MKNHLDCGCLLYDPARQKVKSGASGSGAAPPCFAPASCRGWPGAGRQRVLFVATGALMSQTTFLQKESIPAVAHLVELRRAENGEGEA